MKTMDKTKQTLVIALVAILAVVAGGWFFLISPQRSQVASIDAQTATNDSKNASLQTQIAQLKAESVEVSGAQATLAAIARRLPPDLQEANLLDDLGHAADAANVDLQVVTPSAPLAVAAAAPVAVTTAPATSGAAGATGATTVKTPVAAANQLYQVPLSLTVAGNYFDLEMFVHSLEGMQRAMVITQLSFAKASSSGGTSTTGSTSLSVNSSNGATPTATATSSTVTQGSTGTASGKTTSKSSKTTKTAKQVPGTAGAANAELNGQTDYLADSDTLTVTITGEVFSMYSQAVADALTNAAAAAAAPTTPATK